MRARVAVPLLIALSLTIGRLIALGDATAPSAQAAAPNIVLIYADDLGYGDLSSYGATRIRTPNIDALAAQGLQFTRAHSPSATCTPSRYAMLTGGYAWRRPGTGIARGDAPLLIEPGRTTLATLLKQAGYTTGVVGKWHLGLGPQPAPDWNVEIRPGPLELGFDQAFLIPATGDRVPTVYVEGRRVVGLDPADPIRVSFDEPVGDEPTGREHPELLKMAAVRSGGRSWRAARPGARASGSRARALGRARADSRRRPFEVGRWMTTCR